MYVIRPVVVVKVLNEISTFWQGVDRPQNNVGHDTWSRDTKNSSYINFYDKECNFIYLFLLY